MLFGYMKRAGVTKKQSKQDLEIQFYNYSKGFRSKF